MDKRTIKIIEIAEELEWNVNVKNDYIEFRQYSPAGEDFSFTVDTVIPEEIIEQIMEYADNFDIDEHIEIWIDARRNGVSGVPSTRELVEDAEEISKMLDTLAERLLIELRR